MSANKGVDEEVLLREWKGIFENRGDFYIYGAANTARQILKVAEETGVGNKIKGFVVTNGEDNPKCVGELLVVDIHKLQDKQAIILVPHAGVFKQEIYSLLESLGFYNIYSVHKFTYFIAKGTPHMILDSYMEKAKMREREYDTIKSFEDKKSDAILREHIMQIRNAGQPDFGQGQFYQSFERIGLSGTRPSLYRIEKYGIEGFLDKKQDILDIGCNAGFLDMTIAPLVCTVTGVEYDKSLVDIANCVKEHIKAYNCTFINSDFRDWYKENLTTYNVIFSFAIHHWLNLEPEDYAKKVDNLLREEGYLCFESHDMCGGDEEYEECLSVWLSMGYAIKKQGDIMDDGVTQRKYTILWKSHK